MKKSEFDGERGGYALRYYFNAGINKKTCVCDEEGTDIYDANDTDHYIGCVSGYSPSELMAMSEDEFYAVLEENYII